VPSLSGVPPGILVPGVFVLKEGVGMSTEMLVDVLRREFEATGEALTAWRPEDEQAAGRVAYTEDAIVVFLDRPSLMRRLVDEVCKDREAGRIANLLQTWHEVSLLFALLKSQAAPHREAIAAARQSGHGIEHAEDFERAFRELDELADEFRKRFPVATEEEAAEDRAAIARGEYQDAEEAFARIAGVDVATWRQRVAEHERGQRG
jgi:hypothetical protein